MKYHLIIQKFSTALDDTGRFTSRMRHVEELRNLVKALQLFFVTVQTVQRNTAVLITIGKPSAAVQKLIDFIKAEGKKYIKE